MDVAHQRETLVQTYNQLPEHRKAIVQMLSVVYEPVGRAVVATCLNQARLLHPSSGTWTTSNSKTHIDALLKAKLLTQKSSIGIQCQPLIVEIVTRDLVRGNRFRAFVEAVHKALPLKRRWGEGPYMIGTEGQFWREMRIALYQGKPQLFQALFEDYHRYSFSHHPVEITHILLQICNNPFDGEWFQTLPSAFYEDGLWSILSESVLSLALAQEPFNLLQADVASSSPRSTENLKLLLAEQQLIRGDWSATEQTLEQIVDCPRETIVAMAGWVACLRGNYALAIEHYTAALKSIKKTQGKRKVYFSSLSGLFFILALIQSGSAAHLEEAEGYASLMAAVTGYWLSPIYQMLVYVIHLLQGDLAGRDQLLAMDIKVKGEDSILKLMHSLCLYWAEGQESQVRTLRSLAWFYEQAEAAGYQWLALEAATLIARLQPESDYAEHATQLQQATGLQPLVDIVRPREAWELRLNALVELRSQGASAPQKIEEKRLAWFITLRSDELSVQPREQKITVQGTWSKGRTIALKRLAQSPGEFDYLTPQDFRVCSHLELETTYGSYYYNNQQYTFGERAIVDLVGHPFVFWEDSPTVRLEVVSGTPALLVKKSDGDQVTLEFSPKINAQESIIVQKETPTRLKVIEVNADHRRIATILGPSNQLTVPGKAEEKVLSALNAISGMVIVHSDIGGGVDNAETVPADATPHLHLLPAGTGLKVSLLCRPFAQTGPYFRPGTGGETVIAEVEGKRLQTTRQLSAEVEQAKTVVRTCPTLARSEEIDGEWIIDEPEDCLELLLEAQALGEAVIVEWPEGEKLRVRHQAGLQQFRLAIRQQRDWFEASGEIQLDGDRVLDMQQLLTLLDQSPGRFIALGDGEFIALTQELRKRLEELRAFSDRQGKTTRFHPLAALALEDLVDEVGELKADKHWKAHVRRLKEMQSLKPELPSTLQAELRDYQVEGFEWLARLAHWGVGACLADDMGLGKTLQALAVILTRAPQGPTLIVAPTSVGMNWLNEAQRFAPTLKVIQFSSGDRQALLDQLQSFDMLVCSYGLLQQDDVAEMLAKVEWQTIVLDEAQAIKNMATKRSHAAMALQGGFKLLTTGTPIENHLGELWNLFRFINPGLLGSLESFNLRFANPIERYQDKQAKQQLKKLIQPFILRRTKTQVLEELPSRTEITLHVDLSRDEMALYEALRREAIAKLTDSDVAAGQKHLQVLAELMKLRRACCNSRLVVPDAPVPSAKLEAFGEILSDLLENRHKALVFSQFVDHLQILREYLDQKSIRYQYLDGSTPTKDRAARVKAFQAGEGDVFLISLKAGGTGLNLTAADYVIHMDPWWNPAVEDQASDRAHRIGQQRPVTIYRLVAKGTIEEKIVSLHSQKRDLADSLLEGTDISGKISTDDLLQLISAG